MVHEVLVFSWANITFIENDHPYNQDFKDVYYQKNGLEETRYVYLFQGQLFAEASQKTQSLSRAPFLENEQPYLVAEVGFGCALSFLTTWQQFKKDFPDSRPLIYISCEQNPVKKEDCQRALSAFPELSPLKEKFLKAYEHLAPGLNIRYFPQDRVTLILLIGPALEQLKLCRFQANHWFFDGFNPKENPQAWSEKLAFEVTRLSANKTTLASFSVSGAFRRLLEKNSWNCERLKGFGKKRHCLKATLLQQDLKPEPKNSNYLCFKHGLEPMTILGTGLSALSSAYFLSEFGQKVQVQKRTSSNASSVPYVEGYPSFHSHLCRYTLLNIRAWAMARAFYEQLADLVGFDFQMGAYQKLTNASQKKKFYRASQNPILSSLFQIQEEDKLFFPKAYKMPSVDILNFLDQSANKEHILDLDQPLDYQELKKKPGVIVLANSWMAHCLEPSLPYPQFLRGQLSLDRDKLVQRQKELSEKSKDISKTQSFNELDLWKKPTVERYCFDLKPLPENKDKPTDISADFVGFRAHLSSHLPYFGLISQKQKTQGLEGSETLPKIHGSQNLVHDTEPTKKRELWCNLYHGSRGYSTGLYASFLITLQILDLFHYQEVDISCEQA